MMIPQDIALWLQRRFEILADDDFGLVLFADGPLDRIADYSAAKWQLAVDMLYRTIRSDLVTVHEFIGCSDEKSFFEAIRTVSPYGGDGLLWNGTLIYGSAKLDTLVRSFFPSGGQQWDELNRPFIEAVEQIFAENGVPWSDKPLLPITPNTANSQAPAPR
jgi:hypothetical protein